MSMNELDVLKAACCIAGMDEDVGFQERKVMQMLASRAGVTPTSFDTMMDQALEDDDFFEGQLNLLQSNLDDAIRLLLRVAVVEGKLDPGEREVLLHFSEQIGMTSEHFEQILTATKREESRSVSLS